MPILNRNSAKFQRKYKFLGVGEGLYFMATPHQPMDRPNSSDIPSRLLTISKYVTLPSRAVLCLDTGEEFLLSDYQSLHDTTVLKLIDVTHTLDYVQQVRVIDPITKMSMLSKSVTVEAIKVNLDFDEKVMADKLALRHAKLITAKMLSIGDTIGPYTVYSVHNTLGLTYAGVSYAN